MKSALLLSGGMDSLALAWWRRPNLALTVDYGQLAAEAELTASSIICKKLGIEHNIIKIDCRDLGSGDMAGRNANKFAPTTDWWPYRNQLLITVAAMRAIEHNVNSLWLGTVRTDESHQDGKKDFITAISYLMALQEGGIVIEAPAIDMSTSELIKASSVPANFLAWAHSCHKANYACGDCRGCNKYYNVFDELGYDLDRFREPSSA